jgi:hypothetical protein
MNVICDVQLVERLIVQPSACFAVISIITIIETARLGSFLSTTKSEVQLQVIARQGMLWVSLSVSLNVIVTLMICFRLLRMRALTREVLSPERSSMYTSIAAMLIESAAPFSILGVCLVITGALNTPFAFAFAFVWSRFCVEFSHLTLPCHSTPNIKSDFDLFLCQSLSPHMIILRVAMGRGWHKETVYEISTALVFRKPPTVQEQSQVSRTTIYNAEDSIFGPGVPENSSNMSTEERTSKAGVASLA